VVIGLSVVALVVGGLLAVLTAAEEPAPKPAEPMKHEMMGCPLCGGMAGQKEPSPAMKEMLKEAGITDDMMMQGKAMPNAPLYKNSPAVLLGMAEGLALTEEQKASLMSIEKDAAAKALAVLTDEQKTKLGPVAEKPMSMMDMMKQMHEKMMPVMMKHMKDMKDEMQMLRGCPMMRKMMREKGMMHEKGKMEEKGMMEEKK